MNHVLKLSFVAIAVFSLLHSCKKDNTTPVNTDVVIKNDVMLDGAQERPVAVTTPGHGMLDITYTKSTNKLKFTLEWMNLKDSVTNMHFHGPSSRDSSAPPRVFITGFSRNPNGTISGESTIDDAGEAELLGGKWYYNVHTKAHPGGEIRGQIEF